MIDQVRQILMNSPVKDNCNGVFLEEPDQSTQLPFVVISVIETFPNDSKTDTSELDEARISISSRSKIPFSKGSEIGSYNLSQQVRAALDHYQFMPFFIRFSDQRSISNRLTNKKSFEEDMEFEVMYSR